MYKVQEKSGSIWKEYTAPSIDPVEHELRMANSELNENFLPHIEGNADGNDQVTYQDQGRIQGEVSLHNFPNSTVFTFPQELYTLSIAAS